MDASGFLCRDTEIIHLRQVEFERVEFRVQGLQIIKHTRTRTDTDVQSDPNALCSMGNEIRSIILCCRKKKGVWIIKQLARLIFLPCFLSRSIKNRNSIELPYHKHQCAETGWEVYWMETYMQKGSYLSVDVSDWHLNCVCQKPCCREREFIWRQE